MPATVPERGKKILIKKCRNGMLISNSFYYNVQEILEGFFKDLNKKIIGESKL